MNLLPLNPAQRQFALLLPTLALAGCSELQIDVDVYYVETSAAIQSVRTSENPNSLGSIEVVQPTASFVKDRSRKYIKEAAAALDSAIGTLESGLHVVGEAKAVR